MNIPTGDDDKKLAADKIELRRLTAELYASTRGLMGRIASVAPGVMLHDERRVWAALESFGAFMAKRSE
jgi:hypothetical protein